MSYFPIIKEVDRAMPRIAIRDDDSAAARGDRNTAGDRRRGIAAYPHSDNLLYDITEGGYFFA